MSEVAWANSYLIKILDNINGNPELSEEKIALIDRMEKLIDEHMEKDFTPYPTEKVEYLEFNTNSAQPKKEENTFLQALINRSKQNVSLFNMNEIIKSIKHHIKEKILNSTKEKNNTNLER